jgi:uncharacterized RDD family membrane protein YckC
MSSLQPTSAAGEIGPPGGFWIRLVAYLIDELILSIPFGVVLIVFYVVFIDPADGEQGSALAVAVEIAGLVVLLVVIAWLYEALLTSSTRGATLGKRAFGLRIVRTDGAQLSFGRATGRFFLKAIVTPAVPLGIGYLMAAFTARKRALHDMMADTLVVKRS